MNLDLITFISEYYQLKMDSIHEPLEMLRNLSQTHNDEVLMASMAYRSQIIDLDTAFFEKAITATNFNLDEILKNPSGLESTMKQLLIFIALQIGEEVAKFYDKEVEKI
jgi:hypothetical protein